MGITIFPVTPDFVAEVGDVDLARLSEPELAEIKEAFWRYAVLIFPGQRLSGDQHLAFARHVATNQLRAAGIRSTTHNPLPTTHYPLPTKFNPVDGAS